MGAIEAAAPKVDAGGSALRRLVRVSLGAAARLAGTDMASLRVVRGQDLVHLQSVGLPREYVRATARTPVGSGCCGVAVAEARPVVVDDIPCSRVMSAFQCLCERHALRAVWCLPLIASDNRVLGSVAIYHDRRFTPTAADVRQVEPHVEMLAAAIETRLRPARNPDHEGAMQGVAAQFLHVQEAERRRIAEELHDELIQDLVGIQMTLEAAALRTDAGPAEAAVDLGRVIARLRELVFELRPHTLESDGLPGTARVMLGRLADEAGIRAELRSHLAGRLPVACEQLAYRVVREGIQNVRRHARAGAVSLELNLRGRHLEIWLTDDGVGFDPDLAADLGHFGLASITHQVESVEGSLHVTSAPGRGTALHALIPHRFSRPSPV
jgi:signal transduction histidine kinase